MKKTISFSIVIYSLVMAFIANSYVLVENNVWLWYLIIPAFIVINVFAGIFGIKTQRIRLKICNHGVIMLSAFRFSLAVSLVWQSLLGLKYLPENWQSFLYGLIFCAVAEYIIFWNGIICVYLTSYQLGIKHRLIGILCGLIPIVNLIVLSVIIRIVRNEVFFESEKALKNNERKDLRVCETKYPILFVHGVFFRDSRYLNYWGRIPDELEQNGATVYYGEHHSAASVEFCGEELTSRIKFIVNKTGCEKVNIIAHSKGGLDCRYAINKCGASPYIASLTTVNTPHRGCVFAEYLLNNVSEELKMKVASVYNSTLKKCGDTFPDFLEAVGDLTASACAKFNEDVDRTDGIYCQSIGSVLKKAKGGKFPLNFSYHLVNYFDGPNDGLVSTSSFEWGEKYTLVTAPSKYGISHCDIIDLNRENINGFDVREFYVDLVSDLKKRGL